MAIKTRAELKAYINSFITTNGSQAITGAILNEALVDAVESVSIDSENPFTFNATEGVYDMETDITGVVNQLGLEDWTRVINNTGSTINNGSAVYASGIDSGVIEITLASNDAAIANRVMGLVTADIADGEQGFVTQRGFVRGFDTSSLDFTGSIYLGTGGGLTMTRPTYPAIPIVIAALIVQDASAGIVNVNIYRPNVQALTKSYTFTSQGIGAGSYYVGGYYDAVTTATTRTQAATGVSLGTANGAYAAHPFVVCGGVGVVNTGVVGLRATGTSISDDGTRTTSDTDVIIPDITAVAQDEYYEAKKFIGQVTLELYVVSGSPTSYNFSFNYGWAKYEDFGNRDFSVVDFECVGLAGANDSSFDIVLYKHSDTGWTYAASGFSPGGTVLAQMSTVHSTERNAVSGDYFAFKRTDLNQDVDGADSEGVLVKIVTGANNTVQNMDAHVGVVINE